VAASRTAAATDDATSRWKTLGAMDTVDPAFPLDSKRTVHSA
jgi:hypothetical protein